MMSVEKKQRHIKVDQKGQATVEFALTFMLLMGISLFFIQLCFVFAWGNYVHYATYMSARAFLSAGPNSEDQEERAKDVITRMVKKGAGRAGTDKFPMIAKGVGEGEPKGFKPVTNEGERHMSWMNGVQYSFESRLFMIPLLGQSAASGKKNVNSVSLTSESWLGHEPSHEDCKAEMSRLKGNWDNGC